MTTQPSARALKGDSPTDLRFGAHYLPDAWPERYGIDEPMPDSLAGQFVQPLVPPRPSAPAEGTRG